MKKKLLAIILTVAVLCSLFAIQTVAVTAEESVPSDGTLRAWFDFRTESYQGWSIFADVRGDNINIAGTIQSEASVIDDGQGNLNLQLIGSTGVYDSDWGACGMSPPFIL